MAPARSVVAVTVALAALSLTGCADGDDTAATSTAPPSSATSAAASTTAASNAGPSDPRALAVDVEYPAALGGRSSTTTEMTQVVAHAGALWASSSQWMAPEPQGGALFRRTGADVPWQVVLQSDQLRVMALESITVPAEHSRKTSVEVLLTQLRNGTASELRWQVGDGTDLTGRFRLADGADARSLGAHDEGDAFAFYAGVRPTGILRGAWDPQRATIVWSPEPELFVAGDGLEQKVTGFETCAGSVWATVRASLYRRTDGPLPTGAPRWVEVYRDDETNADNSGLRGITCIDHDGAPALLVGREGSGAVLRFPAGGDGTGGALQPEVEAQLTQVITSTLRGWGHDIPADGPGSVGYVIAAYNEFTEFEPGVLLTGVEWSYALGGCPSSRPCQPQRTFDAAACVLRRDARDDAREPVWEMACLGGEARPAARISDPVERGQAFVAVRALRPAPWDPGTVWLAGYDANFVGSVGTGWLARGATTDLTASWSAR